MDLELRTNEQLLRDLICQIEDDVTNALTDLSPHAVALRNEILRRMVMHGYRECPDPWECPEHKSFVVSFCDLNVPDDEPQDQESDGQPA